MQLRWSAHAKLRREEIFEYIAADNPQAALLLDEKIEQSAKLLVFSPGIGKPGRIKGTRELQFHKHYVLVYELSDNFIYILTIHHTSQQYTIL